MSNLLKDASILLTPTAYDDGSMNAIKPENGDGDLTFSRSSAATRFNAQGLVENVQIISPELVSNGDFSQIGSEEVLNGDFLQEGSELITNGDFSNGVNNWNVGSEVTSFTVTNGVATIQGLANNFNNRISQNINVTIGKTYKIIVSLKSNDSNFYRLRLLNGTYIDVDNGNSSDFETFTYYHKATTSILAIYLSSYYTNGSADFSIDNVSVKEVGQNWQLGSGWSIGDGKTTHAGGSSNTYINQTSLTTVGKIYKAVFTLSGGLNATNYIQVYGQNKYGVGFAGYTSAGTYTLYFTADDTYFRFRAVSPDNDVSVDSVSVKEVGQDWTLGTGWSIDQANSKVIFNDSSNGDIRTSNNVFTINKKYKIQLTVGGLTSGTAFFGIGDGSAANLVTYDNYANGDYSLL